MFDFINYRGDFFVLSWREKCIGFFDKSNNKIRY